MSLPGKVTFEGYTAEELLNLPADDFDRFVFCGEPVVIEVGTAQILGQFEIAGEILRLELAQIDGGGEGVLPAIGALAKRIAVERGLTEIEWLVHAVHCAQPNLKLRAMLLKRGFEVRNVEHVGEIYHQVVPVT